ncbi:PQQ-dependent sugar dehydrogenase [Halosimplex litoreum]|uniref:PQQ-dependent sugar dehydrogenase n=1 Tax=Halosimplex litoreum TaxID=1198301 RepID=A0A7U3WTA1_9EURY|nr:PQQ-dependent sugar dehydrogenase [Halosimplex litoreum]
MLRTIAVTGVAGALAGCSLAGRSGGSGDDTETPDGTAPPDAPATDVPATDAPEPYFEPGPTVRLEEVATGLVSPSALVTADDGTDRRFVLDQVGTVHVIEGDDLRAEPFLDLTDRLVAVGEGLPNWVSYDERGLLGIAFHPAFAENRRLYVRYSAPSDDEELDHRERLSEFTADDDGERVDPGTERVLMDLPWARPIHQAGTIEFGLDGYLYGALGDGLNPFNGQDITGELKGGIFRIDVDGGSPDALPVGRGEDLDGGERPYGIPQDNPLVGAEGRDEYYAWGLRNPWKMAFSGDRLIVGDVGQAEWEEVNVIERGANYGWPLREGLHCHDPQTGTSSDEGCVDESERGEALVDPVLEFPHFADDRAVGFAVIGGHVHTGSVSAVADSYLFGAFTSSFEEPAGRLLAADPSGSGQWPVQEIQFADRDRLDIQVLSLGVADGDSYVLGTRAALAEDPLSQTDGVVYRIASA